MTKGTSPGVCLTMEVTAANCGAFVAMMGLNTRRGGRVVRGWIWLCKGNRILACVNAVSSAWWVRRSGMRFNLNRMLYCWDGDHPWNDEWKRRPTDSLRTKWTVPSYHCPDGPPFLCTWIRSPGKVDSFELQTRSNGTEGKDTYRPWRLDGSLQDREHQGFTIIRNLWDNQRRNIHTDSKGHSYQSI